MEAQRKWIAGLLLAALTAVGAVALANASGGGGSAPVVLRAEALAWVRPTQAPASWSSLRLPGSPAVLPVPPGWHAAHGDPGTRTAELTGPDGEIDGYLNATPQQGEESLANWGEFRVEHNRDEEDRDVQLLASAGGLEFPTGTGSCVLDSYLTSSDHRYREIACIVAGPQASTVIVGAAPPERWAAEQNVLRRAITSFTT
jgi:hypothetical protein